LVDGRKVMHSYRTYLQNKYKIAEKDSTTVKEGISQRVESATEKIELYNDRIRARRGEYHR